MSYGTLKDAVIAAEQSSALMQEVRYVLSGTDENGSRIYWHCCHAHLRELWSDREVLATVGSQNRVDRNRKRAAAGKVVTGDDCPVIYK